MGNTYRSVLANPYSEDHSYETTEHIYGEWIDGSIIYEKTLEFTNIAIESGTLLPHGVTNFGKLIDIEAHMDTTESNYDNYYFNVFDSYGTSTDIKLSNVQESWAAKTQRHWYITIRYTKAV